MATFETIKTRLEAVITDYCTAQGLQIDLAPGSVLNELLLKLDAVLQQQLQESTENIAGVDSIQTALASVSDTYSPVIDKVASNYNIVRDSGQKVSGVVKVIVSSAQPYYIPAGFEFFQETLQTSFVTTKAYRVTQLVKEDELKLYTGTSLEPYYFLLPVEIKVTEDSQELGSVSVPNNAPFKLGSTTKLNDFVNAKAFGSFTPGRNKETDKQLIYRFKDGLSCKGLMSAKSLKALLPTIAPTLSNISVVGSNDTEVTRAKNNAFGLSNLGAVDVYVRTSKYIESTVVEAPVTAVTVDADPYTFEAVLDYSTTGIPGGFYKIESIAAPTGAYGSYNIVAGYPIYSTVSNPANLVSTAVESRFTKYQKCTVRFIAPGASAGNFQFVISYLPMITELQDYMLDNENRILAADYLIKAVVPCHIRTKLTLYKSPSVTKITEAQIAALKQNIVDYINNLDFGESVIVSKIIDICHNYPIKRVDLPVGLTGTIWVPSATGVVVKTINSSDVLSIPSSAADLTLGISPKTTMFFADMLSNNDTASIGVEVV